MNISYEVAVLPNPAYTGQTIHYQGATVTYDGTRWLGPEETVALSLPYGAPPFSGTCYVLGVKPFDGARSLALIRAIIGTEVTGTNTAGNCWTGQMAADVTGSLGSAFSTAGEGATPTSHIIDLAGITLTTSGSRWYCVMTKSGSAGSIVTLSGLVTFKRVYF